MNTRATSIRIFLADGTPEGIRIVDKSNWVGRAVVAGRAQLGDALKREELERSGVYLLIGAGEGGAPRLYVGEADALRDRLKQHDASKDFWTSFVAFTSSDDTLNKALVRYLESRLIGLAKAANQWEVENGTAPGQPPLSEADRADAEWFLSEMLIIYPVLGIDAFEAAGKDAASPIGSPELIFSLRGIKARGREVGDGFVVFKGSQARIKTTASVHAYMMDLRKQLLDRGVLVTEGDHYLFTQDYRFSSPSTAAGVLVGSAMNGRNTWKDARGRTLKDLQVARTEEAS